MSEQDTLIQDASEKDIEELAQLMNELGYPTSPDEMSCRFKTIQIQKDYRTLIASHQGRVAGMIGLQKSYYYEKNGTYNRILALVVSINFRNKGIGSLLIKAAENWAGETGANAILLNSGNRPERISAHEFYIRQGFQIKTSGFVKAI